MLEEEPSEDSKRMKQKEKSVERIRTNCAEKKEKFTDRWKKVGEREDLSFCCIFSTLEEISEEKNRNR